MKFSIKDFLSKSVNVTKFAVSTFRQNTEIYRVNLRIQSEYRKTRTRKITNADIFHAVKSSIKHWTKLKHEYSPLGDIVFE